MKVVVQVRLMPDAVQAQVLGGTLRTVNERANWVSAVAFARGVPREYELRKHTYAELRAFNHIVSKKMVTEAERTSRGIALEDLGGIRQRVRLRKPQRVTLHSWAFHQLGQFVEYKARRAGVPLVYVDPAYTSQECAACHHIEKKNRVDQARFICRSCGVVAHADRNASRNIAVRGEAVWTAGRESRVPATH